MSGQLNFSEPESSPSSTDATALPPNCSAVPAHIPGNIWKILAAPGADVREGDPRVILESMKMEVTVVASRSGRVHEIRCTEGRPVNAGETLVVLET